MSTLQYSSYEGYGQRALEQHHYSQAVRVGDRIECAGQGGWDPSNDKVSADIEEEIAQAFKNVDLTLRTAGGQGWSQVFRVNSYHVPLNDTALAAMVKGLRQWCPDHKPLWTCVGVPRLGREDMHIEIEVVALDPREQVGLPGRDSAVLPPHVSAIGTPAPCSGTACAEQRCDRSEGVMDYL